MATDRLGQKLWRVASASVSGTRHKEQGRPCQDAHHWKITSENALIAGISDGASSVPLGMVGADIASKTGVEYICQQVTMTGLEIDLLPKLFTDAFELVQTALKDEASMREVPVRDLATTLILMIVTPNFAAAAQVGDGAVVVGNTEGDFIALTKPQSGEYVNQTNFITSSDALSALQINVWQGDVAQVSGFSDGIQMLSLKLPDYIPYKPFFSPLFQAMRDSADEASANEQLIEFLNSSRIAERTDDDLTLLLAVLIE